MVSVSGHTRYMAMLGDPVAQVRTPAAINPLFAQMGADIVCLPLHVAPADLPVVMAGLRASRNLAGCGVTLPHKAAIAPLCDRLDPLAAALGVVNVIRREADGALCGYQFDGRGFLGGLSAQGHKITGRPVLLLGAGGAAVAIAHALAEAGAGPVEVLNRSAARAEALVATVNGILGRDACRIAAPELACRPPPGAIVVNATSLGLSPDDALPLDPAALRADLLVAEVIAEPEITPLLKHAHTAGAQTHSGLHMIHGQVALIAAHLAGREV